MAFCYLKQFNVLLESWFWIFFSPFVFVFFNVRDGYLLFSLKYVMLLNSGPCDDVRRVASWWDLVNISFSCRLALLILLVYSVVSILSYIIQYCHKYLAWKGGLNLAVIPDTAEKITGSFRKLDISSPSNSPVNSPPESSSPITGSQKINNELHLWLGSHGSEGTCSDAETCICCDEPRNICLPYLLVIEVACT